MLAPGEIAAEQVKGAVTLTKEARRAINERARAHSDTREGSEEQSLGFHGDRYLLSLADAALRRVNNFIETGSNLGNTAVYVGRTHPGVRVISCEPGAGPFHVASTRAATLPNVDIREEPSPEFLERLFGCEPEILEQRNLFYLDAHGYGFYWPVWDEIAMLTERFESALVLVDDLLVPGRPQFRYDKREDLVLSLESLRPRMRTGRDYEVVYPAYDDRTSEFHPLVGWGLISWGGAAFPTPAPLRTERVRFEGGRP